MQLNLAKYLFFLNLAFLCSSNFAQDKSELNINNRDTTNNIDKVRYWGEKCWENREKDTDAAIEIGLRAIELADSLKLYIELAKVNNYLGSIYLHYIKNIKKSIPYFHKALEISLMNSDTVQTAYAYNNLGDAFYLIGNAPLANEYGKSSLKYFQLLKNQKGIAYSYINLGLVSRIDKKYDLAIDYFNMAIDIRKEINDKIGVASAHYEIAVSYYEKQEYILAKKYFQRSLELHKQLDNKMYIALSLNGLADLCYVEKNYTEALRTYDKAFQYNIEGDHPTGILQNLLGKALVFSKIGELKKGEQALHKALYIANELGFSSNILKTYKTYANFYTNIGDYKLANENYQNYLNIYDSLFTAQQVETLKEMQNSFIMSQNLNRINRNLETQQKESTFLFITVVIFILLGSALLWKYVSNVKLNKKLKQINHSKDKLFSIISHDLRSPFNSILGFSDLLLKEVNTGDLDKIGKYGKYINQLSMQSVELINKLSSWSRTQRGVLKLEKEKCNLNSLIKEIFKNIEILANKKHVSLNLYVDQKLEIIADKEVLRIVLTNLLTNAIKFTSNKGYVEISSKQQAKSITISIKDNGVGIDGENLRKLFSINENYTTLGTNDEKGTGLGLIICKELIDLHQGKIEVKSIVGEGSVFTIILPQ